MQVNPNSSPTSSNPYSGFYASQPSPMSDPRNSPPNAGAAYFRGGDYSAGAAATPPSTPAIPPFSRQNSLNNSAASPRHSNLQQFFSANGFSSPMSGSNNNGGLSYKPLNPRNRTVSAPSTPLASNNMMQFPFGSPSGASSSAADGSMADAMDGASVDDPNHLSVHSSAGFGASARLGKRKSPIPSLQIKIDQNSSSASTGATASGMSKSRPPNILTAVQAAVASFKERENKFAVRGSGHPTSTRTPESTPMPRSLDDDEPSEGPFRAARSLSIGFNDLPSPFQSFRNVPGSGSSGNSSSGQYSPDSVNQRFPADNESMYHNPPNTAAILMSPKSGNSALNTSLNRSFSNGSISAASANGSNSISGNINGNLNMSFSSLPPKSPANSPAIHAFSTPGSSSIREYERLANHGASAPTNTPMPGSNPYESTPRGKVREGSNFSPKTPINTPRVSFTQSPLSLQRQTSAPLPVANSPLNAATPVNTPNPFANSHSNGTTPLNSPAPFHLSGKTPAPSPMLGPMSPSSRLRQSGSHPGTGSTLTPRNSVVFAGVPYGQLANTPLSIQPQPSPPSGGSMSVAPSAQNTPSSASSLNPTSLNFGKHHSKRPGHTRAPSTASVNPSQDEMAKLAILNQGIDVPMVQASLSVPDKLVEELKVRPKGDDVEWEEQEDDTEEFLKQFSESAQASTNSPQMSGQSEKNSVAFQAKLIQDGQPSKSPSTRPRQSPKGILKTSPGHGNADNLSNLLPATSSPRSAGKTNAAAAIGGFLDSSQADRELLIITPAVSWLLVLINKLHKEGIIQRHQHSHLKDVILDVNPQLIEAFQEFQATDNKEALVAHLLNFLPEAAGEEEQGQREQQSGPDEFGEILQPYGNALGLPPPSIYFLRSSIAESGIASWSVKDLWKLFATVSISESIEQKTLYQLLKPYSAEFRELLRVVFHALCGRDSSVPISLYLAVLALFTQKTSEEEKFSFIYTLLDSNHGMQNAVPKDALYSYCLATLIALNALGELTPNGMDIDARARAMVSTVNCGQKCSQQQWSKWRFNPIRAVGQLLGKQ